MSSHMYNFIPHYFPLRVRCVKQFTDNILMSIFMKMMDVQAQTLSLRLECSSLYSTSH